MKRKDSKECPKCQSQQFGFHKYVRQDPSFIPEEFELYICRNCAYQPFTDIRGMV